MARSLTTLLLLSLAAPAVADDAGWQAGFAKVAITPEQSMWMSGYGARTAPSEGKETDLWAKSAVLKDAGGHTIVLVTLDLVGIDRGTSQAVCKLIQGKYRVPREAVALSVSHTH